MSYVNRVLRLRIELWTLNQTIAHHKGNDIISFISFHFSFLSLSLCTVFCLRSENGTPKIIHYPYDAINNDDLLS